MKVAVIGQGYVGLPLALAAADAGHEVIGIDLDESLVNLLNSGKSPIIDVENLRIQKNITNGSYTASTQFSDIVDCDVLLICVPTPLNSEHKPDYSILEKALTSISENLMAGALVILESTVGTGTTRKIGAKILDTAGKNYFLAYSPERIDPSNQVWNVTNTPKLVAGIDANSGKKALDFYKTFVKEVHLGESLEVVETAKLLENSFRLINISFVNEMAKFCWKFGIDILDVIEAAATKPYGFMPFYPSAGIGGHCIPVDPAYLQEVSKGAGIPLKSIDIAMEINDSLPEFISRVAIDNIGPLTGKRILLVGICYKPNVADTRETPAKAIIEILRENGAEVFWQDDLVSEWNGEKTVELGPNYHLAILLNPHTSTDINLLKDMPIINARRGYL